MSQLSLIPSLSLSPVPQGSGSGGRRGGRRGDDVPASREVAGRVGGGRRHRVGARRAVGVRHGRAGALAAVAEQPRDLRRPGPVVVGRRREPERLPGAARRNGERAEARRAGVEAGGEDAARVPPGGHRVAVAVDVQVTEEDAVLGRKAAPTQREIHGVPAVAVAIGPARSPRAGDGRAPGDHRGVVEGAARRRDAGERDRAARGGVAGALRRPPGTAGPAQRGHDPVRPGTGLMPGRELNAEGAGGEVEAVVEVAERDLVGQVGDRLLRPPPPPGPAPRSALRTLPGASGPRSPLVASPHTSEKVGVGAAPETEATSKPVIWRSVGTRAASTTSPQGPSGGR